MFRLSIKVTDKVTLHGEGETDKEAMLEIAPLVEAYDRLKELNEDPERYTPNARKTGQGYEFFELKRDDGDKVLKLGQTKEGNKLFPKELGEGWKPDGQSGGGGGGNDSW